MPASILMKVKCHYNINLIEKKTSQVACITPSNKEGISKVIE
jgi:hypothetical protein